MIDFNGLLREGLQNTICWMDIRFGSPTTLLLATESLLSSKALLLSSHATMVMPMTLLMDALDALEQVHHLVLVNSSVTILVALLDCLPDLLLTLGRGHAHRQAEIAVSMEELLPLELS